MNERSDRFVDEFALLRAWQLGDAASGSALLRRYTESLYGFFLTKTDPTSAEELTQATFEACTAHHADLHEGGSVRAYLFAIARKKVLQHRDEWRRRGVRHVAVAVLAVIAFACLVGLGVAGRIAAAVVATPRCRSGERDRSEDPPECVVCRHSLGRLSIEHPDRFPDRPEKDRRSDQNRHASGARPCRAVPRPSRRATIAQRTIPPTRSAPPAAMSAIPDALVARTVRPRRSYSASVSMRSRASAKLAP